jgi:thioesterase domain-containing protein
VRSVLAIQPRGPYRIVGWSLRGIVAYPVAGLLLGRDSSVELLGFIHEPGGGGARREGPRSLTGAGLEWFSSRPCTAP